MRKSQDINNDIAMDLEIRRGIEYKPAIPLRSFSSKGLTTQAKGWKTKRVHHFFSDLEYRYFLILEWSKLVTDIREQFPVPTEETLKIAEQAGIKHPINPQTKKPNLITTDFVITIKNKIGVSDQARTIKPSNELQKRRTLEKFELERRYWESRNISWGIVTEHEIPSTLVDNIKWVHSFFYIEDLLPLTLRDIKSIAKILTKNILQANKPLKEITADCDDRLGFEKGDSLSVVRHLIATRKWQVDMNQLLNPRKKLQLLTKPQLVY